MSYNTQQYKTFVNTFIKSVDLSIIKNYFQEKTIKINFFNRSGKTYLSNDLNNN